jgi:hypothetical protein
MPATRVLCQLGREWTSAVVAAKTVPVTLGVQMCARDQPRAALESDVGPEPLRCHDQPIAKANQEVDVRDAPDPPGKPPLLAAGLRTR